MQMIHPMPTHVNSPSTSTLALEAKLDAQIKLQAILIDAGFYPVYGNEGFNCVHPQTKLQFRVEFSDLESAKIDMGFLHQDELPEADDTLSPDDDDAMMAAWGITGVMPEISDAELDAMYASLCPADDDLADTIPTRRLTSSQAHAEHQVTVAWYHAARA